MKKRNMILIRKHKRNNRQNVQKEGYIGYCDNLRERFIKIAVSCGCKGLAAHARQVELNAFAEEGLNFPPGRGDPFIEAG